MAAKQRPVLTEEDLNGTDRVILEELHRGRATPALVAERQDLGRSYVSQRLIRLREHGHVTELVRGLYELVDDPREDADTDTVDVPDAGYDEVRLFVEDGVWIAHHLDTGTEASAATKVDALRAIIKAFADQDNI